MTKIVCTTCGQEHEKTRVPKKCKGESIKPRTGLYFYLVKTEGGFNGFCTIKELADYKKLTIIAIQNKLKKPEEWIDDMAKVKSENIERFAIATAKLDEKKEDNII